MVCFLRASSKAGTGRNGTRPVVRRAGPAVGWNSRTASAQQIVFCRFVASLWTQQTAWVHAGGLAMLVGIPANKKDVALFLGDFPATDSNAHAPTCPGSGQADAAIDEPCAAQHDDARVLSVACGRGAAGRVPPQP